MIDCEFLQNDICLIASRISDYPAKVTKNACETCIKSNKPKDINRVTVSLACKSAMQDKRQFNKIFNEYTGILLGPGCGTSLHTLLKGVGFNIEANCPCLPMIHRMNREGVEWCKQHKKPIIESITTEFNRRYPGIPVPGYLLGVTARKLVTTAIENYEKETTNFQRSSENSLQIMPFSG